MPKKDDASGDREISDIGNWNSAAIYSKEKIMKPLARCDVYTDIATSGYGSLIEELANYNIPNDNLRYNGLKSLVNELLKICNNSMFAMKKKGTKETLENIEKSLERIEKVLHLAYKIKKNDVKKTREMRLIWEKFEPILKTVKKIKKDINFPLNQNHLIFTDKEEFDPNIFKTSLKERMVSKG